MAKLTSMINIGKEMEEKLKSVGIHTKEELIDIGSKQAFLKLKKAFPQVCLVHLYTLDGAISNIAFHQLPEERKKELKAFKNSLNN